MIERNCRGGGNLRVSTVEPLAQQKRRGEERGCILRKQLNLLGGKLADRRQRNGRGTAPTLLITAALTRRTSAMRADTLYRGCANRQSRLRQSQQQAE